MGETWPLEIQGVCVFFFWSCNGVFCTFEAPFYPISELLLVYTAGSNDLFLNSMGAFLLSAGTKGKSLTCSYCLFLSLPFFFSSSKSHSHLTFFKPEIPSSLAAYLGKRYSLPNSRIMIHQPLGGAQGGQTDIDIQV